MDWRPIDTAPKDGTAIDLWVVCSQHGGKREANAYWVSNEHRDRLNIRSRVTNGWWGPNHFYEGDNGWIVAEDDKPVTAIDGRVWSKKATHWMPLPDPPK